MFTLFNNPSECKKCGDICCRFSRGYAKYAPFFSFSEKNKLIKNSLVKNTSFRKQKEGFQLFLKRIKKNSDYYYCPIFSQKTKQCSAYDCRSLDCSLYPFLILKNKNGKPVLGLDLECPVAKKAVKAWGKDKKFTAQVKRFCSSQKFKDYLKNNSGFVEEYIRDVLVLYEL